MTWRTVTALLFALVIALAGLGLIVGIISIRNDTGPRNAFQAHIRALDEGRVDDANALVDISCAPVTEGGVQAAREGLESKGLTFKTAFHVSQVWVDEQDTKAFLKLDPPPGLSLPTHAEMVKVDGDWKVSCGSP